MPVLSRKGRGQSLELGDIWAVFALLFTPTAALTRGVLPRSLFSPILKGMEVHFTPEQEAQLARLAARAGTDAEQLVKETVLRLIEDDSHFRRPVPELPGWNLGAIGSLHRRDLYDDVR
jgi:hypothetical protein